jgi:hypothetical protein
MLKRAQAGQMIKIDPQGESIKGGQKASVIFGILDNLPRKRKHLSIDEMDEAIKEAVLKRRRRD